VVSGLTEVGLLPDFEVSSVSRSTTRTNQEMNMNSFVKNASAFVFSALAATVVAGCAAQAADEPESTNEATEAWENEATPPPAPAPVPVPAPAPVPIATPIPAAVPTPIPTPVPAAVPVPVPACPLFFLPGFGCNWLGNGGGFGGCGGCGGGGFGGGF
jgi:outer membrane biosynthesis protein TonB